MRVYCLPPVCIFLLAVGNDATLDAKITELRPYFREDFLTYLQSEYSRVTRPPMTDEAVTLANLLQVIQARLLAEVRAGLAQKVETEDKMGSNPNTPMKRHPPPRQASNL